MLTSFISLSLKYCKATSRILKKSEIVHTINYNCSVFYIETRLSYGMYRDLAILYVCNDDFANEWCVSIWWCMVIKMIKDEGVCCYERLGDKLCMEIIKG